MSLSVATIDSVSLILSGIFDIDRHCELSVKRCLVSVPLIDGKFSIFCCLVSVPLIYSVK